MNTSTNVIHTLGQKWNALTLRDQRISLALIALLLVALLIAYLWLPLVRSQTTLQTHIPQLQSALATMKQQALEVKRLSLLPAVASTKLLALDAANIKLSFGASATITAAPQGSWQIHSENLRYAQWLDQLDSLLATTGAHVESFELKAQDKTISADVIVRK